MTGLWNLTRRNVKLFFKDKGTFISSLITPIILLVLYATFLAKVYKDSFMSAVAGMNIDVTVINGTVGAQLVSSLLAVSCVTVAFCSNLLMIQDKTSGARADITVSPVKRSTIAISYFLASAVATLIISFTALGVSLLYLLKTGWYMSLSDVLLIMLDVFLLTIFGTALSSCINFPLSTNGQASAVGTIVSSGYGFICGAYMPLSNFSGGLQNVISFLPGTYGTSLLRNHALRGVYAEMADIGFPPEIVESIKDSIDCNIYFFGTKVGQGTMYIILTCSIVVFVGIYILMNVLSKAKKHK